MMKVIGYCVWDAKTQDMAKHTKLFRRERDAMNARPSMLAGGPRPGISVIPLYADVPRICTCGRPEDDHHVRHPFVPAQ